MAAELSIISAVVLTIDGGPFKDVGSQSVPVKGAATAIADGTNPYYQRWKVPAGEAVVAWEWNKTSGFAYIEIRPVAQPGAVAEGFIEIGLRYNPPTSGTDLTPVAGTNRWKTLSKSCVDVFSRDTERAYIHATAANEVGQSGAGALAGGNVKYPGVWDEGARVRGVCDALSVLNESDSDYLFDVLAIPK